MRLRTLISLLLLIASTSSAIAERIQFKADYYTRDVSKSITRAKGNAWVKKGAKEIWADELEIDFARDLVSARGNVHIRDGDLDIWCDFAIYNMVGEDAVLENATLSAGQVVMTGMTVNKKDKIRYEIEDGTYTNCNTDLRRDKKVANCTYDWKVYGDWLSVTTGEYVHIRDAIVHTRGFPIMYFPYLIFPIKTERETGFLLPIFSFRATLGTGITTPFFWAMSKWQDLTIEPTYHTQRGLHLGTHYSYIYDDKTRGRASFFLLERRFAANRDDPSPQDNTRSRALGLIGEGAVTLHNTYQIGRRSFTRQVVNWVSDPYYLFDYQQDIKGYNGLPSLRSQLFLTVPGDGYLFTAEVQHHQSMIISDDSGIDRGEVSKLPSINYSLISTPFLNQYFSYEFDSNFTSYVRPGSAFDSVPSNLNKSAKVHVDPDPTFGVGDYLRVGRRLQLEPRLVANIPMPQGFQFQPLLRTGALIYHFDLPVSQMIHREYATIELPASVYLSKTYDTGIKGFEKINHVIQPRFVYANNFFQGGNAETEHPFFYRDTNLELSNPRFDLIDEFPQFEFMRFELINRFRRKTASGAQRFFLLQISEQYNVKRFAQDLRFSKTFGPIEVLSELAIWRFSAQLQARYQLETTQAPSGEFVRENDWSATVAYTESAADRVAVTARFANRVDDSLAEQTAILSWFKTLPIIFDLQGEVEYSFKKGNLVRYFLGFHFGSRRRNCWQLSLLLGQNELRQPFARVNFRLGLNPTITRSAPPR